MAEVSSAIKERTTTMGMKTISALAIAMCAALAAAAPAPAAQAINAFEVTTSSAQAGDHPDLGAILSLADAGEPEAAKDIVIDFPQGVFGNPGAAVRCIAAEAALNECPIGSQIGLITVRSNYLGNPNFILGTAPLYNLLARSDETALFSFVAPTVNIPVNVPLTVRTGSDYGIRMTVAGITQKMPVSFAALEVWGFPAEQVHDIARFGIGSPDKPAGCPGLSNTSCDLAERRPGVPVQPLTDNPSVCTGDPLTVSLSVRTYQDPGALSSAESSYPATTGCEKQHFKPVLGVALTTKETDAPAGMDLTLKAPQFLSRATAPSNIRSAVVTLPAGLSINPDAADGQTACSDADAGLGSEAPARCPDSSKIGTFDIGTPALTGPLRGSLFFGEPKPGNQYRVIMVASGFGMVVKHVADIDPDPETGRLIASVEDLPQVPFEEFNLHLFASQRGLLATPIHCTLYRTEAVFTPWNATLSPQTSTPFFELATGPGGAECPGGTRPFEPRLVAGTSNPTAGAFSDFTLQLDRDDGDQFLGDLNFKMPPGFTGNLTGIPYCPESQVAAAARNEGRAEQETPSCPAASQIGTTNVAAGPGSHPFHAVGRMYLTGPFGGASLSLAAVTPALAGPYDYGVVVVRVGLRVDPLTAQVSAISDRVPAIIGGVPIRMRSIRVNIDRSNFTINPTNCSPLSVESQGIGDQGTVTEFNSYFQAVNCSSLPFRPRMKVTQLDRSRRKTKRNANPRLRFELFTRSSDANLKDIAVTLPKAFQVDQRHLGNICSKAQLASERCEGRQPIGYVETRTPLLDEPLSGPAYAVSGYGLLPHLAFILDGQVTLIPQGESRSIQGGKLDGALRTTVPVVPDAPIGYFRLDLLGGGQGYLINTKSLCHGKNLVRVAYTAQNGKRRNQKIKPRVSCGVGRKAKRASHSRADARR